MYKCDVFSSQLHHTSYRRPPICLMRPPPREAFCSSRRRARYQEQALRPGSGDTFGSKAAHSTIERRPSPATTTCVRSTCSSAPSSQCSGARPTISKPTRRVASASTSSHHTARSRLPRRAKPTSLFGSRPYACPSRPLSTGWATDPDRACLARPMLLRPMPARPSTAAERRQRSAY